jgi:TonB family protein
MDGLADIERATTLDPENAELFYILGVSSYEVAAKHAEPLSMQQKRDVIRRGLAAFHRAESLRADYFESLTYRSLLLREQAKLESDPAVQRKLIEEADATRQRAVEVLKARRAKVAPPEPEAEVSPSSGGPLRVGGDVKAPIVIRRVEPVIPDAARKARVAGIVIIEAVIDKEGRVANAKVLKPLPLGLDEAALEAVKQWTFRPGTLNGEPVDVIFNLTVNMKGE